MSLASRDTEGLETIRAGCQAQGERVIAIPTDVTKSAQCEALIQKTVEQLRRIDILVNNAGVSMWAKFDDVTDLGIFEKILRVNYLGNLYCTYFALPYLKQSRGQVVGVSSLAGRLACLHSGYAASKHAVTGFFAQDSCLVLPLYANLYR